MTNLTRTILALIVATALAPGAAAADWFAKLGRATENLPLIGTKRITSGAASLEAVTTWITRLPVTATDGRVPLAVHIEHGIHWTMVNRSSERFTAATSAERARGLALLAPGAAMTDGNHRLALYMTANSVTDLARHWPNLPKGSSVFVIANGNALPLSVRTNGGMPELRTELRPGLNVSANTAQTLDEVLFLLARPLDVRATRVLALEPGGPKTLASRPRLDPVTSRPLVDQIDPASFPSSLDNIRNQTALIVGQREGAQLRIKPASGPATTISGGGLITAGWSANATLILLVANSPRQPGGRNALWVQSYINGLDEALGSSTLADFLAALGRANGEATVDRIGYFDVAHQIGFRFGTEQQSAIARVGSVLADVTSELTGAIIPAGGTLIMPPRAYLEELDKRIVPGVPSVIQWSYIALVLLGLLGLPIARRWWSRVWPPEARSDYANASGYWSARTVRVLIFAVVFMPLTAIASAMAQIVMLPVALGRWATTHRRALPIL